jgi:hypothetical protein
VLPARSSTAIASTPLLVSPQPASQRMIAHSGGAVD